VKRDMENTRPMDRLVCGDVGYGKTEVAMRAAFKAVMDGKQVAMLVPTTILAQQHYDSFRERMAAYPVRIEMLSRFQTRARAERHRGARQRRQVDIVIGTHRLLQGDVASRTSACWSSTRSSASAWPTRSTSSSCGAWSTC
jgi:transcription-repair coupling factor (superfamily II helicase)